MPTIQKSSWEYVAKWFHLFGTLKKHLAAQWLATNTEIKQAVISWLQIYGTDFSMLGYKP